MITPWPELATVPVRPRLTAVRYTQGLKPIPWTLPETKMRRAGALCLRLVDITSLILGACARRPHLGVGILCFWRYRLAADHRLDEFLGVIRYIKDIFGILFVH